MGKYKIQAHEERCTGCLRCQLACSDLYAKVFNPSVAMIRVTVSGADCDIRFTDECNDCGVCVDHCFYDALEKSEKEQEK